MVAFRKTEELSGQYIIWNPNSPLPPTSVFTDRPAAIRVAHRMASQNRGERFCVCKIVGVSESAETKYTSFED